MKKFASILLLFLFIFNSTQAQILDDEFVDTKNDYSISIDDDEQPIEIDDELLFDEMFSEFSEEEKDITKTKTFDDAISRAAERIKQDTPEKADESKFTPMNGNLYIGISKGSFRTFTDLGGNAACSFGVSLLADIDRNIKTLGLQLVYNKRSFAFIFKDVKKGEKQEKYISTRGDICYNMAEVPNIEVNLCKASKTANDECAKKIRWDSDIESPDPKKNPYL